MLPGTQQERHKASSGKGLIIILIQVPGWHCARTKRSIIDHPSTSPLLYPTTRRARTYAVKYRGTGPATWYGPRPIPISRSRKVNVLESSHCRWRWGPLVVAARFPHWAHSIYVGHEGTRSVNGKAMNKNAHGPSMHFSHH
jgi:hypothetical protein